MTSEPLFNRVALIGIGLIGSSLARAIADHKLSREIAIFDAATEARDAARELKLGTVSDDLAGAVKNADLVILATPIGTYADLGAAIAPHLKQGAILSDVGSVKQAVIRDLGPHVPEGVHFIPGHPIAGTEHSGPHAGFAELFKGRWCIITPLPGADTAARQLMKLWSGIGSMVESMEPGHHDQVLAITSHLPHLIAYTIVDTATSLEASTQSEIIKFSASGFRDFTRIAASDPTMWRDVFLNNREAVLEILGRFTEDLTALQRAIRWGEGDKLFEVFTRTRAVRRGIIDAKQAWTVARKTCKDMAEVRAEIDALDRAIVALLADRLHFIGEAARIKASRAAVRDEPRIEDVIAKVRAAATAAGMDPAFVEPLYRDLVERSIAHEFGEFDRLHRS